jgi:hypothetical protein
MVLWLQFLNEFCEFDNLSVRNIANTQIIEFA